MKRANSHSQELNNSQLKSNYKQLLYLHEKII